MPLIISLIAPGFNQNPEKFLLTVDLARLTFPFVVFVCLTSLVGGYLNTLGKVCGNGCYTNNIKFNNDSYINNFLF